MPFTPRNQPTRLRGRSRLQRGAATTGKVALFSVVGVLALAGILALMAASALFSGLLLWLAWNLVVQDMFHGPHIHYWVAVLVMFLVTGVFGGSAKASS